MTNDLGFGTILAHTHDTGPSVIQIRAPVLFPTVIGNLVTDAIKQFAKEIEKGCILVIDEKKHRARMLPIKP